MLLRASTAYNLDRKKCVVWNDMLDAHQVGMQAILVKTGALKEALQTYRDKWKNVEPIYVAENILDAIHLLV